MKRRLGNPAYERFYRDYRGETSEEDKKGVSEQAAAAHRVRRRIDDVREGLRLDRELFAEVWEL